MSRTLSMNTGSRLSLKAWLRCGCQGKSAPDAADAALAESGGLSQRARGPVRGVVGLGFQGARQHAFDRGVAQAARRARTRFIEQLVEAEKDKTLSPLAHGREHDWHAA